MKNLANLSETALSSQSYQDLSKEVGKDFIGKSKEQLVKIILDRRAPKPANISVAKVGNTDVAIIKKPRAPRKSKVSASTKAN